MAILIFGMTVAVAVVHGEESSALTGTRAPLFRSEDHGISWQPLEAEWPGNIQGSFLARYRDELVFATDNAGVFLSFDQGTRWNVISHGLTGKKINALLVGEEFIWVGVFQHGLFFSEDEGNLWHAVEPQPPDKRIHAAVEIGDSLIIGADSGIYHSKRPFKVWRQSLQGDQVVSLQSAPGGIVAGTTSGVARSTDGGLTWTWIHQQGALHTTAVVDGVLFAMYISGDLFFSRNTGDTWTKAVYSPHQESYVYSIVGVGKVLLLSNNYGVHRSRDGGKTWELIYPREDIGFFGLYTWGETVYGAVRDWKERRKPSGLFDFDLTPP